MKKKPMTTLFPSGESLNLSLDFPPFLAGLSQWIKVVSKSGGKSYTTTRVIFKCQKSKKQVPAGVLKNRLFSVARKQHPHAFLMITAFIGFHSIA